MANYSDMKATKESRSDKFKNLAKSSSSSGSNNSKSNKSSKTTKVVKRKAKKEVKKFFSMMGLGWIIVALCLVVGLAGGFFTTKYICRFDTYEMVAYENGEYDITIGEDEDAKMYKELGIKCKAFGKDVVDYSVEYYYRNDLTQDEVKVEGVDTEKEGIYYAVYKVNNFKYKSVKLIRNIIVTKGAQE